MDDDQEASRCISAAETRQAYEGLVASRLCGDGSPCMRDQCPYCGPVNRLIDERGAECQARGCTVRRCVYDAVRV